MRLILLKFRHQEQGIAILFASLIMALVLALIGASILGITVQLSETSYNQAHNQQALSASQSGLDDALYGIRDSYRGTGLSGIGRGSGHIEASSTTELEGIPGVNQGSPGGRPDINEVQLVTVASLPTAGNLILSDGTDSATISATATTAQIKTALEAIYQNNAAGSVDLTITSPTSPPLSTSGRFSIQFGGDLAGRNMGRISVLSSSTLRNAGYVPQAALTANWNNPRSIRLGESCYQYWYGFQRGQGTPTTADDTVIVHILSAAPYQAPTNFSSECDLRQATGSNTGTDSAVNLQNGKIMTTTAEVQLSPLFAPSAAAPNYLPPRVLNVRWSENFGRL